MNRSILWSIGLTAVVTLVAAPATDARGSARKTCSATAAALYTACKAQTVDDTFVAKAKCLNVTDSADRTQCLNDIKTEKADAKDTCREMRDGRRDACRLLGESPYDPKVDQTLFDDPHDLVHANRTSRSPSGISGSTGAPAKRTRSPSWTRSSSSTA